MKIFKGLLIFCVVTVGQLRSQEYVPLLDNFNEWHFTTCYFGCLTDVYYTDGDTLVDGVPHKILDGYHYISRTFLLREDVVDKKVYLTKVNTGSNSEYLLYDFNLEEGDSIEMSNPITPFPSNPGYFTLDSIRLKPLVDGNDYRHYYFSPSPSNTISTENCIWVEGVGSLSLINAPSGNPNINEVGALSCFFKNGTLFYQNLDSIEACEPVLNVLDITKPLEKIILHQWEMPNTFRLRGTKAVTWMGVYDISGKQIQSHMNTNQQESLFLDLRGHQSGLYLLVIRNSMNQERSIKMIVR